MNVRNVLFALLLVGAVVVGIAASVGCSHLIGRITGGPPFHVVHPDPDGNCICNRFGEICCTPDEVDELLRRSK